MGVNSIFKLNAQKNKLLKLGHIMETTAPIQTKFCTVTETTNIHVQFVGGPNRRITIQDGDGHLQNALTS